MPDHTPTLCFSTGSLHVEDTSRCFALAAEAGFDAIEVLCDDRWSTRNPAYLANLSQQYSLPVAVIHAPFSWRNFGWDGNADPLRLLEHSLALAEMVGAEALVVHLPDRIGTTLVLSGGRSSFRPALKNPFRPLARFIKEGGLRAMQEKTPVRLCVENLPKKRYLGMRVNPFCWNTLAEWPTVHRWLTLDTTHWATFGIQPLAAYEAAAGRVGHIHLSNYDGREHRLPYEGDLDLGGFLERLASDGYHHTLTVELHPDTLAFTDETEMKRRMAACVVFCRQHLG